MIILVGTPYYRTYDAEAGSVDLLQDSDDVDRLVLASAIAMFVWGVVTLFPSLALHRGRFHEAGLPGRPTFSS